MFLPEILEWQILPDIEGFKWKSSILAREREAIGGGEFLNSWADPVGSFDTKESRCIEGPMAD
jgi:hypothetical protein